MAAYYYKGLPMVAPFTFRSNQDLWSVEKRDKSVDVGRSQAQRWEIDFSVITNDSEVDTFIQHTSDFIDTINDFVFPQLPRVNSALQNHPYKATNSGLTVMSLDGASLAGDDSIAVTSTNRSFIPKGYFVKFQTSSKIHVTTSDTDISTGGITVNMDIFPPLVKNLVGATTVKVGNEVLGKHLLSMDNMQGITFKDGVLAGIDKVTLIEDL
jgi:hypothetical protein